MGVVVMKETGREVEGDPQTTRDIYLPSECVNFGLQFKSLQKTITLESLRIWTLLKFGEKGDTNIEIKS